LPLIFGKISARFTFPSLASDNAEGHTHAIANGIDHRAKPFRRRAAGARNSLESQHNQPIPRKHRQGLAEGAMHGRPAPARIGIIETGQVIMHQARAMQQLNRGGGSAGKPGLVIAAGSSDRERQAWADARPFRENRVTHRGSKAGRRAARLGGEHRVCEAALNTGQGVHAGPPEGWRERIAAALCMFC
jgi:hypothetical protein